MIIHRTAIVDPRATLSEGVVVGAYSLVGRDAVLGRGVEVGSHCKLGAVKLGPRTRVRSYVELRDGTEIGERCDIDSGVKASGNCRIGDGVIVRYDAIIARGCVIGDRSFISPQVMFVNLNHRREEVGGAHLGQGVHIGTNATIQAGLRLADEVVVGAKALVTRDCDVPGAIYVGIPARRRP